MTRSDIASKMIVALALLFVNEEFSSSFPTLFQKISSKILTEFEKEKN
jgi:hypothetical protein